MRCSNWLGQNQDIHTCIHTCIHAYMHKYIHIVMPDGSSLCCGVPQAEGSFIFNQRYGTAIQGGGPGSTSASHTCGRVPQGGQWIGRGLGECHLHLVLTLKIGWFDIGGSSEHCFINLTQPLNQYSNEAHATQRRIQCFCRPTLSERGDLSSLTWL